MSEKETPLSERVVKEAIGAGMDSPMRDSILEAVEEADGGSSSSKRMVPAAGLLLGAGAAVGYLLGRSEIPDSEMRDEVKEELSDIDIPDAQLDSVTEPDTDESKSTESSDGSRGWLSKLVVLGVTVAAALAWRRRRAAEDEWEPIEEFEPATDAVSMDASEEGEDEEAAESEDEDEDEAEAEDEE
ncbi:hypothetical protein [Natronosalvus caseinilyticus]|uniref:hypothetical protein n=1 Tax=Natronosalvus caseinilyticus TaxID=2953747 RepID=UPI0028A95D2C|nr:hypothetical protein [Natronosalvus caseinilyticus]